MPTNDYDPTLPWHPSVPNGCRRCGRNDRPHEGRGLCTLCWSFLRRYGGLWRYPVLYGGAAPGNANRVGDDRLPVRALKWQRQRTIHEQAWADGKPWLHDGNCTITARKPDPTPPASDLIAAETAPSTVAGPYATAEERRAAQLRWAEQDRRNRLAARRRSAA